VGNYEIAVGGDLILAIDGQAVASRDSLTSAMNRKRPGDSMELTIFRAGRTQKLKVKLAEGSTAL
jgi:S1-C subfamily serine protease